MPTPQPERPTWASDVPISLPSPPPEGDDIQVPMYGFVFTNNGLFHDISDAGVEGLQAPLFSPERPD